MNDETKLTHRQAPAAAEREIALHPYQKPVLVARERLSRIAAADSKVSGIPA